MIAEKAPDAFEMKFWRGTQLVAAMLAGIMFAHLLYPFLPGDEAKLVLRTLSAAGVIVALVLVLSAAPGIARTLRERREEAERAHAERKQLDHLFRMTEMLQSASGYADANAVLGATIASLLKGYGAALYVFNNSRDRLELSGTWQWPLEETLRPMLTPSQCWALKRGKWHVNGGDHSGLRCDHHLGDIPVLEIPMTAHGEIQGMVQISTVRPDPDTALARIHPLAAAIADAMSLAVSNIALREKLRTQALRDPLTGLYNRRYMEDALSRFSNLAERGGTPLSIVMIDLDHFKKLNDEFGHAVGDAVLREAAAQIMGALRTSDVACRYGGEELIVILPECGLSEAVAKAELLRERIEALSATHDAPISASFGVAALPENARLTADLLGLADAALYQAKGAGRNRVVAAPLREPAALSIAAE